MLPLPLARVVLRVCAPGTPCVDARGRFCAADALPGLPASALRRALVRAARPCCAPSSALGCEPMPSCTRGRALPGPAACAAVTLPTPGTPPLRMLMPPLPVSPSSASPSSKYGPRSAFQPPERWPSVGAPPCPVDWRACCCCCCCTLVPGAAGGTGAAPPEMRDSYTLL